MLMNLFFTTTIYNMISLFDLDFYQGQKYLIY